MKLNNLLAKERIISPSRDVIAGLVVAFAMIPEAIAFSGIAGVDPRVGLFGAFLLSVTLAIFGGRMAMITSVTGSTALLMTGIVQQGENISPGLGLQYLLAAGLLTGVLQIAWGYLRLAHQMRFVPQPVMDGFVNGLAILIFLAQLPHLGIDLAHSVKVVTATQVPAVWGLTILTLLIIYLLPKVTKILPSALVAIFICTAISIGFKFCLQNKTALNIQGLVDHIFFRDSNRTSLTFSGVTVFTNIPSPILFRRTKFN